MAAFSIKVTLEWLALCGGLALALLIPGYTLLLYLKWLHDALADTASRVIAALSLSILATPLVFLVAHLLHLPLGTRSLLALLCLSLVALWLKLAGRRQPASGIEAMPIASLCLLASRSSLLPRLQATLGRLQWANLALLGIFLAGLSVRVAQGWGEPAALGSDAYHHTLISQLVIDNAGIPNNYLPYAPLGSFTYHYAFHALVAVSYWLGGAVAFGAGPLTTAKLTLMVGQVLSAFAPLVAYLLARHFTGSTKVGLVAALIPAVIEIFPTYYINWGRDTQMVGLLGLPLVMIASGLALNNHSPLVRYINSGSVERARLISAIRRRRTPLLPVTSFLHHSEVRAVMITGTLAAGLFLAHYRIIILFYFFLGLYTLVAVVKVLTSRWQVAVDADVRMGEPPFLQKQTKKARISRLLLKVIGIGIVNLIVVSPWLFNLLAGFSFTLAPKGGQVAQSFFSTRLSDIVSNWWFDKPLTAWLPSTAAPDGKPLPPLLSNWFITSPIVLLAAAGWLSGIIRRQGYVIAVGLWAAVSLALSNPYWLPIPLVSGRVDYQTVVSAFWLPASMLIGYLAVTILEARIWHRQGEGQPPQASWPLQAKLTTAALLVGLAFYAGGALAPQREDDRLEAYLQAGDIKALTWLKGQAIPAGTLFLVNTFTYSWSPNSRTGSDGGLWLPLLTQRGWQTTAPPLPYNNEVALGKDYRGKIIDLSILATQANNPNAVARLKQAGVRYAYIGARSVQLGTSGLSEKPELAQYRKKNLHIGGTLDHVQFDKAPQLWEKIYNEDDIYIYALK